MGLDLTLLPFYGDGKESNFAHTVLPLYRDGGSFEKMMDLQATDVDSGFCSYLSRNDDYEESHYGETLETPYGERLQWIRARYLKPLVTDAAVSAYLMTLDDNHKIALFWH